MISIDFIRGFDGLGLGTFSYDLMFVAISLLGLGLVLLHGSRVMYSCLAWAQSAR